MSLRVDKGSTKSLRVALVISSLFTSCLGGVVKLVGNTLYVCVRAHALAYASVSLCVWVQGNHFVCQVLYSGLAVA